MKRYGLGIALFLLLLAVVLFFIHPMAPLFLLLSLLVQAPIIWGISRSSFKNSYIQRSEDRRRQYAEDKNAQSWLAAEEAEARSVGYRYWSSAGKSLNALNRADALLAAGRPVESRAALNGTEYLRLCAADRKRYDSLEDRLKKAGEGREPQE